MERGNGLLEWGDQVPTVHPAGVGGYSQSSDCCTFIWYRRAVQSRMVSYGRFRVHQTDEMRSSGAAGAFVYCMA